MTNLLLKLFVENYQNTSDPKVRDKYISLAGVTGIVANFLLFLIKGALGLVSGSVSIIADACNNLSDTGSSLVTLIGLKLSKKPADPDHPFGHGRIEYMSAFIVSLLILLVGFELLKSSVEKIISPAPPTVSMVIIVGLVASILIKFFMFFFMRKLDKAVNSGSLKATAQDSLNDCIATGAVLVAMIIAKIWLINLDAVIGVLVALFILWSGINTARDTLSPLLGEPPEQSLIEAIENHIMGYEEFSGIHDLIVHNYGPGRQFASVHVEVPEDINIVLCHELIDKCELEIKETLGVETVLHMDPIATNDEVICEMRAKISAIVSEIHSTMSIHDFRMVEGENRTNLIFDVLVPAAYSATEKELRKEISKKVKEIDEKYVCVITFDRDFTGRK